MPILLALLLCLPAASAWAVPIAFDETSYATTALVELGSDIDVAEDGAAPPAPLPIQSNAALDGDDAHAFADAIGDELSLATVVDLLSGGDTASAVATADFLGRYTSLGRQRLSIDFESFSDATGGSAGAVLAVTLTVGLQTLFDEIFDASTRFDFDFEVTSAIEAVLGLSLIGSGEVNDGAAFNLSTVSFALNTVPEPGSLALSMLALGLVLSSRVNVAGAWARRAGT